MVAEEVAKIVVSVSDFKAHCTDYLRSVEKGERIIEITRHGKTIAIASAPEIPPVQKSILGVAKGTATLSESYDPHAPVLPADEWEAFQD